MTTTIRPAAPSEVDALHELAAATFPLACPPGTLEEDMAGFIAEHLSVDRFTAHLEDPARRILVADTDGDLVGYTMLVFAEPADAEVAAAVTARPTVELSKCYVLPDAQGGTTAGALLAASVEAAEASGAASIWLGVNQHNARANRFYEKSGFDVVGTKHFRVGAEIHDDFTRERVLARRDTVL